MSGYNGTKVLSYAKDHEMPSENRTNLDGSTLQDHVIDFSYANGSRYEYTGEYAIRMNAAEAANLSGGSLFYIPEVYGNLARVYKVDSISENGSFSVIYVSEASAEEAFVHITISEELAPDWSGAVWAEGVEAVQEKVQASDGFSDKIVVNYSKTLGDKKIKGEDTVASLKLTGSAEIGLKSSVGVDVDFGIPFVQDFSFNSFDFKVDIDGQVSGGISFGADNDDYAESNFKQITHNGVKDKEALKKVTNALREKAKYDVYLGAVPLDGKNRKTSVYVGIYLRVGVSGKIEIVSKVHGTLIQVSYKKGSGWSRTHSVQWNPLSLSAAVDIDFGLAAIAEAKCWGIGSVAKIEAFAGLNASAELNMDILQSLAAQYTTQADSDFISGTVGTNGGSGSGAVYQNFIKCADIKINIKVEVTFATDLEWLRKIIDDKTNWTKMHKSKWTILELKWPIKSWHLEAPGLDFIHWKAVDSCTNSFVTVDFYTGTGEKLNTLRIQNNTALGTNNEPVTTADPGKRYVLQKVIGELEGWYVYEGCTGPEEYANGVGSKRKWNFKDDKVSGNTTLYAEWRSGNSVDVVFKPNFTSKDPAKPVPSDITQTAIEGALLTNPGQIKRDDYRFNGWYIDAACTKEWKFDTDTVSNDKLTNGKLILYAGWTEEKGYDPNKIEQDSHGRMSFNGHSYRHIADYKSYAEAEADAKRQGGYLCTINSAEEQAFLAKYMYDDCAQTYLWLGMTSNDGWNYWKTGEAVTYENWESAPTSSSTQYNAAIRRVGGKWTTLSNSETAHYVIEWGTPTTDPNYNKTVKSDLTFTPNGDGISATVTGIQSGGLFVDKSNIVIPKTSPEGLTVTGIAEAAFKGNSKIETISIPNTVTSIGNSAFENCTKLKSVILPSNLSTMGTGVFKGCTSLGNVVWASAMTSIPDSTFDGCTNLATISNIAGVTSIGNYAFRNDTAMTAFPFPAKLSSIGQYAFYGNTSLREIVIPDDVTVINLCSFCDCTSAFKISVPDNVTSIGYNAFDNCRSASDIYLPKAVAKNSIGDAFINVNGTFHVYQGTEADEGCKANNKTIEYLGAQQKIKFFAGEGSAYEPSAKDGDMLTEIYVEVGKRVTEPIIEREGMVIEGWYLEPEFITKWDFAADKVPEHSITLYAKWVTVSNVFSYNVVGGTARITGYSGETEQVLIPDQIDGYSVTHIMEGAFNGNTIREIVIPASVTNIASGAFDCPNLERISLRSDRYFSVHEDGVLYLKSGKQLIYAPQGLTYKEYHIPETVNSIRNYAFRGHTELDKVFIPDTVASIGNGAFEGNHMVTLYGSVNSCAAKTYADTNLLPYNMYIVNYVYEDGSLYTASHQAGSLIEDYFEPMADFFSFGGWYKDAVTTQEWNFRTDLMPQGDLTLYLKWDTLFDIAVSGSVINITGYRGTATDIIIPTEIGGRAVVGIDSGAFLHTNAKTIQVPDSVTTIEESAFPATATIICSADSAARTYAVNHGFKYNNLTYTIHFEVDGGSEVTDINVVPGRSTTLPTPVKSNYYFYGWYTDTTYMDSVKWSSDTTMPANDVTLYACWRSATTGVTNDFLYNLLDDGTIEITGYSGAKTVLSVPDTINGYTVTRIGDYAFESNNTVVSITLPNTVSSIGRYAFAESSVRTVKGAKALSNIEEGAFRGATSLTSIALTTNLRTIGDYAFQRCSSLTSFTLPKGTLSIGAYAFNDCEYLEAVSIATTLSYLGKDSFTQCPRLTTISIPSSLVGAASDAFDAGVKITYKTSTAINFTKFNISGNSIDVTWNKVQGASAYVVESKRTTNKTFQRKLETSDTKATLALGAYGITYNVRVVALDANGEIISESLPTEAYLSKLATPSITSVTQINASSATMVLAGVAGVDGYEVERAYSEDDEFTLLKSVTSTSFRNTGLMKGFDYYYRVRAYSVGEDGGKTYSRYSDVYLFHMPYKFVVAPENVMVRQTSVNAAVISWDSVVDAEGYIVYRSVNGGAYKQLRQTNDTYTTNTALTKGGVFSYKVVAYFSENGEQHLSSESEVATLTVQAIGAPEISSIKQLTATGVSLTWTPVKGASGYKLYKANSADGTFTWEKNITSGTTTTYSTGMTSGNTYFFVIRAYVNNEDGSVSYSNDSPVTSISFSSVAQVSGLVATQTAGEKAKLTWTSLSGVDGYEVWVSAVNNKSYELAASSTTRTAILENLNDGVTYYVKVRGYTGSGENKILGLYSDEVSFSAIGSPTLQVAEQNGTASVQLIWTKVNSADGYEIWRKDGSGEYKLAKKATVNSATIYSLAVGTNYSFKVRPYKLDDANQKNYGFDSNTMSVYIVGTTKITSLIRSGGAAVTLTWDKADGANGYNLYRSGTVNGVYKKIKSTTDLSVSNTGLTKGEVYYFKIVPYRTVNGVNVEGRPTAAKGIRMLEKPVISSVEQTAAKTLTITWGEVPLATSYRVYRAETATGEFTLLKKVTGATTATSINLTQNKWYYYTVEAGIDEDNTTYYSQQSTVVGAYVTSLAKSEITSIAQTSSTAATITWKKVSGANGYELLRATSADGPFTSLKVLTANTYADTGLSQGTTYYYKVRPYKTVDSKKAYGLLSDVVGALILPTVQITALDRTANKRVDLYWNAVEGATSYNVYRSSTKDGTYTLLKSTTDTTTYNSALTLDATYYYKVEAVVSNGSVNNVGPLSSAKGITLTNIGATTITSVIQTKSAYVKVAWKAVANAEGYELSMAKEGDETFTKVKNVTGTSTSTSLNLVDGQTFRYRVRAYVTVNGAKEYGSYSTPVSITLMAAPTMTSLYQTANTRVEMTWTDSADVTGYEVYRKAGTGSYGKLKRVTEPTVYNSALTVGTSYSYKVRAYKTVNGITSYSGWSNELSITPIRYSVGTYPESTHDYTNNMNESWSYTLDGAQSLKVTFVPETSFENNCDILYITDKNGNAVGNSYWTGTQLAGTTIIVPGDTINLRMTTDYSVVRYGFAIESIVPAGQ